MLRSICSWRLHRPRYGVYICAMISTLLLVISVSLLYTRLFHSQSHHFNYRHQTPISQNDDVSLFNPLISDNATAAITTIPIDDKIDKLDDNDQQSENSQGSSWFFFDHVSGVIRRGFNKKKIEDWDEDYYSGFSVELGAVDKSIVAFGSDDVPVDMEVRRRMTEVAGMEDALMVKVGKRVSPFTEEVGGVATPAMFAPISHILLKTQNKLLPFLPHEYTYPSPEIKAGVGLRQGLSV